MNSAYTGIGTTGQGMAAQPQRAVVQETLPDLPRPPHQGEGDQNRSSRYRPKAGRFKVST